MTALLNTIRSLPAGYVAPALPHPCGPRDLAAVMSDARRQRLGAEPRRGAPMSPISDAGVERLVEAAFYASLLQDEGRWPRCRLRNATSHPWSRVVTLRRTPVAADTISRLAALCHSAEHALSIIEEDGALQCDGLVDTGPMGLDGLPGRPEIVSGGSPVALDLQILGPGRLVVRDRGSLLNCELRGGRLRLLSSIWHAPAVRSLFDAFGRRCLDAAAPDEADPARDYFGGAHGATWLTCALFGPVLGGMVHAGHGGAIIITPRGAALEGSVEFGSEVRDLDLKAEIAEYWAACLSYSPGSDGASVGQWQRVRARLRSKFASLVGLTSVDGCVVLDDDLRVRRIGAQITVEDARAQASGRPFRCSISGEAHDYRQFMDQLGGMRHRSAARLCAAIGGAVAFVVSQDGGLTLFCSDESSTFGYGPMDADWWG